MTTTKRDYYEILGVERGASGDAIKRSYRALAMKHHPDRVGDAHKEDAEEKFKEISEAYAVLSDAKKREVYDQFGHAGFDQRYSTEDIFRSADFSSIFEDLGFGGSIFDALFGGDPLGMGGRGRRAGRGADLELNLTLTFEEAAAGVAKPVTVPRRELCTACRGEGGDRQRCPGCGGTGQLRQAAGFLVIARPCVQCGGQGSALKKACRTCRGEGRVPTQRKIQVTVPAGVESGMRLRLSGEGEGGVRGRGDLYVHLTVKSHSVFRRDGADLLLDYPLNIAQAALGAEVQVPTMNGRLTMKIPAGTQSGTVFRLRDKGLPELQSRHHGDLLVHVLVETPTNLNATQRKFLEEFGRTFGDTAHPSHRSLLGKLKDLLK